MAQLEITVFVSDNGDFGVGRDLGSARQSFVDYIGSLDDHESEGYRVIQLNLEVPCPQTLVLAGQVPEQGGEVTLTVE